MSPPDNERFSAGGAAGVPSRLPVFGVSFAARLSDFSAWTGAASFGATGVGAGSAVGCEGSGFGASCAATAFSFFALSFSGFDVVGFFASAIGI